MEIPGVPERSGADLRAVTVAFWVVVVLFVAVVMTGSLFFYDHAYASNAPAKSEKSAALKVPLAPGRPLTASTPLTGAPDKAPVSHGPVQSGLVNASVEQAVIKSTWMPFAKSLVYDQPQQMARFADPSVVNETTGALSCGCSPWPPLYSSISYSAPVQTSYPLYFLAMIQGKDYEGSSQVRTVVFTQPSPTAPWKIAYMAAYGGVVQPFNISSRSLSGLSSSSQAPISDLLAAPQDIENIFQQIDQYGTMPTLPTGLVNDGLLQHLMTSSQSTYYQYANEGFTQTTTHTLRSVSPVFRLPAGLYYECTNISLTGSVSSATPIVQPPDQSQWGNLLAPGSYTTISFSAANTYCFSYSPGVGAMLSDRWGGAYSYTGS
ncbi:MAG: hypothetical protein ACYDEP_13820 [Acidimicrobiales bacterium]